VRAANVAKPDGLAERAMELLPFFDQLELKLPGRDIDAVSIEFQLSAESPFADFLSSMISPSC
jgi:hypothetical protein